MAGIEAFLKGWVSRMLPQAEQDNDPGIVRLGRFGDVWTIGAVRKQHGLADEGSYFVAGNAQTGIISSLLGTTFAETTLSPYLIISNTDSAGNQNSKRIHLDYINLIPTVAGAAGAGLTVLQCGIAIDTDTRYSSGGTDLSTGAASGGGVWSPNMDVSGRASTARIRAGVLTLNAASSNRRIIVGQRQLRQLNLATAMCVANDSLTLNFGGVENVQSEADTGTARTVSIVKSLQMPPVIVGPGQCIILHLWSPGAALTTGITFLPEVGWWER